MYGKPLLYDNMIDQEQMVFIMSMELCLKLNLVLKEFKAKIYELPSLITTERKCRKMS